MATSDNERYLRYILLLGKGGPLVLKGILKRKAKNVGKPLSQILSNNSGKLRQLIRNDSQYDRIFPPAGPVNDDLDNWDTSLLCLIILNIFRSSLTPKERDDIRILRDFRNEIQGHSASLALSESEYNEYRSDLIIVLLNFSSKIDRQYHVECQKLIKSTKSGPIEISSTLDDFKEFQTELLTVFKADFGANSIKLDDICKEIKKIQGTTVQQKELAEENHHRLCQMENGQDEIRQKVEVTNVQQKELAEKSHRHFCKSEKGQDEIIQMLKELMKREAEASTKGNTDIQEDVETKLHVQSKNDKTASSAEDMLVQKINELLREVNSAPEPKTINEEHVRERVQKYLQAKKLCSNDEELTLAIMELMIDIFKQSDTTILPAEKCCIRFVVRCKSYTGLLGLLEYLESKAFDQRIQDITTALRKQTEISVFLKVVVSAQSLQQIKKNLMQTQITTGSCEPRNRTVSIPVRSRNIRSIEHVWKLFQEGDINHHLLNISRILSTIVGGNIEITSSINLKKLKQSLQNIESNTAHTSHDESKTLKENLDKVFPYSISDRDVVKRQAHPDVPFIRHRLRQLYRGYSSSHSSEKSGSIDDRSMFSALKHRYKEKAEKQYGDTGGRAPFSSWRRSGNFEEMTSSIAPEAQKGKTKSLERKTYHRESDKSSTRGGSYHEADSRSSFKDIDRSRSDVKDSSAYSEKQREMSPDDLIFKFRHAISKKGKAKDQSRGADSNVLTLDIEEDATTQRLERLPVQRAKIHEQRQSDKVHSQSFATEFKVRKDRYERSRSESVSTVSSQKSDRDRVYMDKALSMFDEQTQKLELGIQEIWSKKSEHDKDTSSVRSKSESGSVQTKEEEMIHGSSKQAKSFESKKFETFGHSSLIVPEYSKPLPVVTTSSVSTLSSVATEQEQQ